jgi:RNA recognition motif-containing protein
LTIEWLRFDAVVPSLEASRLPDLPDVLVSFRFAGMPAFGEQNTMKKLYVGNLPFTATETEVRALFEKHGDVSSVALINDRETGRPRGFGFVEMADSGFAKAMQALNGYEMDGRTLMVNEAQDKPRNSGGGGSSRGNGGGYGGGGRDRW